MLHVERKAGQNKQNKQNKTTQRWSRPNDWIVAGEIKISMFDFFLPVFVLVFGGCSPFGVRESGLSECVGVGGGATGLQKTAHAPKMKLQICLLSWRILAPSAGHFSLSFMKLNQRSETKGRAVSRARAHQFRLRTSGAVGSGDPSGRPSPREFLLALDLIWVAAMKIQAQFLRPRPQQALRRGR